MPRRTNTLWGHAQRGANLGPEARPRARGRRRARRSASPRRRQARAATSATARRSTGRTSVGPARCSAARRRAPRVAAPNASHATGCRGGTGRRVHRRCPGTRARRSCRSAACSGSEPSPAVRSPIVYPRSFAAASRSASYFAVDISTALRLLSASSGRRARARALASRVGVACPWNRGATWRANSS